MLSLFVTVKLVQSVINLNEGSSAYAILVIELGGLISNKNGHRGKDSNGMRVQLVFEVTSSILVVSHMFRFLRLAIKAILRL